VRPPWVASFRIQPGEPPHHRPEATVARRAGNIHTRSIDQSPQPVIALALLVPLLVTLFFMLRFVPWSRPGPWRLIWTMTIAACLMFVLAEAAALVDPEASGLAASHQGALFVAILAVCVGLFVAYSAGYKASERARRLALTDPLTQLANRRAFEERVTIALERREPFTLAYIDLDGFKPINDKQGHNAGDAVLRDVASTLRAAARQVDLVSRVGGDEFAMLLLGSDESQARTVSGRVFAIATDRKLPVGMSIGSPRTATA
jgi:diguanylate cyclase (GGDEF)-like protein